MMVLVRTALASKRTRTPNGSSGFLFAKRASSLTNAIVHVAPGVEGGWLQVFRFDCVSGAIGLCRSLLASVGLCRCLCRVG
jgi:hypothetical protein